MKSLSQYADLIQALKDSFLTEFFFASNPGLKDVLDHRRLIIVMNHSTPLSWLPAITLLSWQMLQAGSSSRVVRGVMDRWFYNNPLTRGFAGFLTQIHHPQTFEDLLQSFETSIAHDLIIFPEGANTFFGDPHEIQEFRSNRFIELAIRTGTPLLLAVHSGSESWSTPLTVTKEWSNLVKPYAPFFAKKICQFESLNIPLWPRKLPFFEMTCHLHWPELKREELSQDPGLQKRQIETEARRVRERMQNLLRPDPPPPRAEEIFSLTSL